MRIIQEYLRAALDLLFPPLCVQCHRSGSVLCDTCLLAIPWLQPPLCRLCGLPQLAGQACRRCLYHPLQLSGLRAISSYQEPLRSSIHALKYNGNTRLADPLGVLQAQAYQRHHLDADLIIPVPLHQERLRQRGYNQAALLAQSCAATLQIPLETTLLYRGKTTSTQVALTALERRENLRGAFYCAPDSTTKTVFKRKILIIDDVSTTGATLEACAAPLFAAGAQAVWGLVLARPIVTKATGPA
ncbi:ComF family protein [Dictyobacter vulcani]|uniref:ComF family protein n=1 Tax=Dictyobacter vulcani TaxID=2607529 RepID=UPI0022B85476|nr:ComF family protein [Dictyobacter vulcani]